MLAHINEDNLHMSSYAKGDSKTFPHALLLSYSQNSLRLLHIMIVLAVVAALKSHGFFKSLCST